MELTPISIYKIRNFLDIIGLSPNNRKGDSEHWTNWKGKEVIISVAENEMPPLAIAIMLAELKEDPANFIKITSVIH